MNRNRLKWIKVAVFVLGMMVFGGTAAASEPIELYTPYTHLYATPGQSINYSVEIINNTDAIEKIGLTVQGLPNNWKYELKSGSWAVQELSVKSQSTTNATLTVEVPLAVEKGMYNFQLASNKNVSLPIVIQVIEQGVFKTEFTSDQPNLQGSNKSSFTYTAVLFNKTAAKQTYALRSAAPRGWNIQFKSGANNVSSIVLEPGVSETITVDAVPSATVTAGTYKIPIEASNGSTNAPLELEAVITGSYALELTTPTGLISTDITAGKEKKIELLLKNTGTSAIEGVSLTSMAPVDWEVTFDNKIIPSIAAGESKIIVAAMKASSKSIAGDYVVAMNASAPEAAASSEFRVAVKTSILWGWLGILIIAAVFAVLFYLFRKFGRR